MFAAQAARDPLFEDLHDSRGRSPGWFADQQVDVLWHHDVAHQGKLETFPHFAKNLAEEISCARGTQERQSAITTEGNEMEMPPAEDADQMFDHGRGLL